jgi:hypothetical protein
MAVDWAGVSESIRLGMTGRAAERLRLLISPEAACESDRDRAAICGGKAMCYAHLGNLAEAMAQIKTARQLAGSERDLMLQIELSEAAARVLGSDYQTACDLYEGIASTYSDLLAKDRGSEQEFKSDLAMRWYTSNVMMMRSAFSSNYYWAQLGFWMNSA